MHFINISDLVGTDWRFLEPVNTNPALSWSMHYGAPRNALERRLPRPAIGRYRAAWSAAWEARSRSDAVLVSHLPRVSAACNQARRLLCPDTPHIGFAFNFTTLPQGRDRARLTRLLGGMDAYVVFSRYEAELYPDYFGLPEDKVTYLPWTMEAPDVGPDSPVAHLGRYLCSIGGEGRDYALLAEAMRGLPDQQMVIIARPYSIEGISFPDNVHVFTNLPGPVTWRVAQDSEGLVVPLRDSETACGHITIVGSQLLGLPLLVTQSLGVADYITPDKTGLLMPAGDLGALREGLRQLYLDPNKGKSMGEAARRQAEVQHAPQVWLEFFERFARGSAPKQL